MTLLLQQIRHHEDESDWPEDPEFPWELAIEMLEELQASGAAIGRIPAVATQAEPQASGPASAGRENATQAEPSTGPLPVQLPPEPEQWQSVWDTLELSPRARALGELTAALRQTEAGQLVCISPATAAAAMFELLANN